MFGLLSFHVLRANRKMNHDSGALARVFTVSELTIHIFVAYSVLVGVFLEFVLHFFFCPECAWPVGFSY